MKILFLYTPDCAECANIGTLIQSEPSIRDMITGVDVRNEDVFDLVTKSALIDVNNVPCLLILGDAAISKYEGLDICSAFVHDIIDQTKKPDASTEMVGGVGKTNISELGLTPPTVKVTDISGMLLGKPSEATTPGTATKGDNSSPENIVITTAQNPQTRPV